MPKSKDIELAEFENRLAGQVHSLRTVELEILKLKFKIEEYSNTLKSINQEIEKTKMMIKEVKEIKIEGGD